MGFTERSCRSRRINRRSRSTRDLRRGRIRQCAIDQAPWYNLTRVGQEQWRSGAEDNPFLPRLCIEQQAISQPYRSLIHRSRLVQARRSNRTGSLRVRPGFLEGASGALVQINLCTGHIVIVFQANIQLFESPMKQGSKGLQPIGGVGGVPTFYLSPGWEGGEKLSRSLGLTKLF